jgi:hypothetical protein
MKEFNPVELAGFDVAEFERKRKIVEEKGLTLEKERRRLQELLKKDVGFNLLVDEFRKNLKIDLQGKEKPKYQLAYRGP